ncbi:hypothetical protein DL98DRAFT_585395 [Cadophora sp. DSE1049]|nr:hypothetical protein DL98DRAFT_585395 [Cadophora sp. DSE1049]
MPTAVNCSQCDGAVIPFRDERRKKLDWMVYSFGNEVQAAKRFPDSVFPGALEDFEKRNGIAIRVSDRGFKYLLARHPYNDSASGNLPPRFSRMKPGEEKATTMIWNDLPRQQKKAFRSCLGSSCGYGWGIVFALAIGGILVAVGRAKGCW